MSVILPATPIQSEFRDPSPRHNSLCGQECASAILRALGRAVSADDFDAWLRQLGYATENGTWPNQICQGFARWDIPSQYSDIPLHRTVQGALSRSHYSIVMVRCNYLGEPQPASTGNLKHWITVRGLDDGGNYVIDNSGLGRSELWPVPYLESADLGVGIEIGATTGIGTGTVVISGPAGTVQDDDLMNDSVKRAWIRVGYEILRLGGEPSPTEQAHAISALADDGSNLDPLLSGLFDSPEATLLRARLRVALAIADDWPSWTKTLSDALSGLRTDVNTAGDVLHSIDSRVAALEQSQHQLGDVSQLRTDLTNLVTAMQHYFGSSTPGGTP